MARRVCTCEMLPPSGLFSLGQGASGWVAIPLTSCWILYSTCIQQCVGYCKKRKSGHGMEYEKKTTYDFTIVNIFVHFLPICFQLIFLKLDSYYVSIFGFVILCSTFSPTFYYEHLQIFNNVEKIVWLTHQYAPPTFYRCHFTRFPCSHVYPVSIPASINQPIWFFAAFCSKMHTPVGTPL